MSTHSGDLRCAPSRRPGWVHVYDRGELLYLCGQAYARGDCPAELQEQFNLTDAEVAAVLAMGD